jgi:hypothetical protein
MEQEQDKLTSSQALASVSSNTESTLALAAGWATVGKACMFCEGRTLYTQHYSFLDEELV